MSVNGYMERPCAGSAWKRLAAAVISRHQGRCGICGHPDAGFIDHIRSQAEGGALWDPSNLWPAHGSNLRKNPCPVCSKAAGGTPINCNNIRMALSVDRARKVIAAKITRAGGVVPVELADLMNTPFVPRHGVADLPWPPPAGTKVGRQW